MPSPSEAVRVCSEPLCVLETPQFKLRSLPSELLSIIFQHACPTTPDIFDEEHTQTPTHFHLILRLVSTLWYNITQSTPQLWASIFLPKLCTKNVDIKARYLKLCLENSGSLPLTLSFQFDQDLLEIGWLVSPIVDATLVLNAHRIRALRLLYPPSGWLEKIIPKMSQLAAIYIDSHRFDAPLSPDQRDQRLFLPTAANINRIHIRCPCLLEFRFQCATLSVTHVDIHRLPIDFVMEFLLKCPNLIDFCCRYPLAPSKVQNPRSILTSPFTLTHLSAFTWSTTRILDRISEWDTVLFKYIHFPALTKFTWWPGQHSFVDDTALALPLSKFPKSVATLQLCAIGIHGPTETLSLNHFLPFTGVVQLHLLHCDYSFVEQAFVMLSQGTDLKDILFPQLTSIVIDYRVTGWQTPPRMVFRPESGKKLAQMLRTRIGLITEFKLVTEFALLAQGWNEESWQAVREVKRDGIDLTIIEDECPTLI
ncbi:hypothetical protein Agabi119p4_7027 [Agaricus bisporus var. burnettii]|uniref:F-box domain-containing protein n=1 Tax=Agaricus bisporus var. burnettii TaxID=192524 RepID=A0A8H7F0M4_AGABI|nr:hypothetical protein Agabi119p4_7027 [Agaricus bisporus var. burnettii]